ncbi:MAG TPA: glycine zipper 2TM domain-containing protein [Sulfuriferula sp.]|nr:glycine zipper 2TM domain-containing protein [Sulfuriferula sp.]
MKTVHKALAVAGMATMLLGGCANSNPYPDNQSGNSTRYSSAYGIVDSINAVQTDSNGSPIGIGTVIGGVVGGVLGNQVGGGTGRTVATAAGAVGGAVVGHEIEKNQNNSNSNAYRIGVRLDNGGYESFTQDDIGDMRVGDRVRIDNGRVTRY